MPTKKVVKPKTAKVKAKKLVNHVIVALDASPSMHAHILTVREVIQKFIADMRQSPIETRLTILEFANRSQVRNYDVEIKDRVLDNYRYSTFGTGTALIRSTLDAIEEGYKALAASSDKEDHSVLLYVVTDGYENQSGNSESLRNRIAHMDDSWTVAIMVPDQMSVHSAKLYGFPAGNIKVWDATSKVGVEEAGQTMSSTYSDYTALRTLGTRTTSNLFAVNAADLSRQDVRANLSEVKGKLFHTQKDREIRELVEESTGKAYVKGSAFYELTKREEVQAYKELVVIAKSDDKRFGGPEARKVLGVPDGDIKLKPGDHGPWRIFVQSTSTNRKVPAGSSVFVKN